MDELELAKKERDEYLNGWKRAKADLANFRKETEQTIAELTDILKVKFLRGLLPVLDSLEESSKNKIEGLTEIRSLLKNILVKEGLEEIKVTPGEKFDPEFHESVEGEGDEIDTLVQKGYKYKNYVVRPAKVKVRNE